MMDSLRNSAVPRILTAALAAIGFTCPFSDVAHAQTPPQGPPGTVTLPLAEYNRLLDRASTPLVAPDVPPLPAVVSRAELQLQAATTGVRGTITLSGEVFRNGPTRVPLLSGGILLDAQHGGTPLPLLYESGVYSAILQGPGAFSLVLNWSTDVTTQPGRAEAKLPAIPSGSVRATIEVSGESTEVRVEPGAISRRSAAGGKSVVEAVLDHGVAARLSWSSRDSVAKPPQEARFVSSLKSLITIGENEIRLAALFDVSVVQGQLERLAVAIPAGFEVLSTSGTAVDVASQQPGLLSLAVREPTRRRYEFLIAMERSAPASKGDLTRLTIGLPAVQGAQREAGEIAVEGIGALDFTAEERGALHRLDPSEVSGPLRSLAREALLTAFRYQRQTAEPVGLECSLRRYPNAPVLAAIADRATVTTLVTSEGRALTEVALTIRNQGQPFLKVGLPSGATLLSAEVAGEQVKPAEAADGARVPLLRPGLQPTGAYRVAFVYLQSAAAAFSKKGQAEMTLARLDVPVGVLEWEMFLPERYAVRKFQGDALPRELVAMSVDAESSLALASGMGVGPGTGGGLGGGLYKSGAGLDAVGRLSASAAARLHDLRNDQVGGVVVDQAGAAVPGAAVTVRRDGFSQATVTDSDGAFVVPGVPPGGVAVTAMLPGFVNASAYLPASENRSAALVLQLAGLAETAQVTGASPSVPGATAVSGPSMNVQNLQRRVAGVLPVRIDVPRAGHSFVFVRPLVVDEPTTMRFEYRAR